MRSLARTSKSDTVDIVPHAYEESETVDIFGILTTLWRRKWMIACLALLGAVIGWYVGNQNLPEYTAEAAVVVEPRENQVVNIERVVSGLNVDNATIATELELIRSRANLIRVMEDLGLFEDPEFNPAYREKKAPLIDIDAFGDQLFALVPQEWLETLGLAEPPPETDPIVLAEQQEMHEIFLRELAQSEFRERIRISNDGLSYVIRIAFTSTDPEKAARVANRLAEVYVEGQIRTKLTATDRASSFLEDRLEKMRQEVQAAEEAVASYRAETGLLDTSGIILSEQELSTLNADLITARAELAERQAKLRLVRDLRGSGVGIDAITDVTSNPVIISLRNQEAELLRREAELASQFGPRHPQMIQLQNDKSTLQAKVNAEIARIASTLENDVRVVQTRIATIEAQLAGIKTQNVQDRQASIELAELERQALSTRELYEQFLTRFKETREQQELVEPDSRIVAVAAPPISPSTPGNRLYVMLGFTASIMAGSALALLLERLDKGIRNARQIDKLLGLSTIGMVPKLERLRHGQKPHQYLMDKPMSAYTEAIRSIYMSIKLGNVDNPSKLVLITSSLPEEGKTTLAVSLAVFAARSHKKVLLIDLDLRHPSVHRELGWQVSAGIVEYMAGDRDLDDVIQRDIETGLEFLPVKAQTTNPTDLLDSQKMRELLALCRDQYDLVIIDSAPIGSVTDARPLAVLVDKVVYAVQWGETASSIVEDNIFMLQDIGAELSGIALTRVNLAKHAQYGYGDIGQYYNKSKKYYVN